MTTECILFIELRGFFMIGNQIRHRLSEIRTEMPVRGTMALRKADKARAAEWAVRFAIAFVLSGSEIFGGVAPFAVGFTAAAGSTSGCIASMLGMHHCHCVYDDSCFPRYSGLSQQLVYARCRIVYYSVHHAGHRHQCGLESPFYRHAGHRYRFGRRMRLFL
jgi:hypothetical protein